MINKHNLIVTALVFILILFFKMLFHVNTHLFDPVTDALQDYEITDMVYSKLLNPKEVKPDTNIVIINIGDLDRKGIAELVNTINSSDPAVLGIDILFKEEKNPEHDSLLRTALASVKHLVMPAQVEDFDPKQKQFKKLTSSHPQFETNASLGFINVIADESHVVRTFPPQIEVKGNKPVNNFAVQIASEYSPQKARSLFNRHNKYEYINYIGNISTGMKPHIPGLDPKFSKYSPFIHVEYDRILHHKEDLGFLRNKIVLLGFTGDNEDDLDLEDRFFTPLNEKYAGKSFPDMHGVVIHANIISMILSKNYINRMPKWMTILIAVLVCHINVVMLYFVYHRRHEVYHGLSRIIQLTEMVIVLFLTIFLFKSFQYRMELSLAMYAVLLSVDVIMIYDSFIKRRLFKE